MAHPDRTAPSGAAAVPGAEAHTADPSYEVRVSGLVPPTTLLELGGVEDARQELRTVMRVDFADQAALYGFLNRVRAYGLDVVEVRRVASVEEPEAVDPLGEAESEEDPR
jgi:hypothetical protein